MLHPLPGPALGLTAIVAFTVTVTHPATGVSLVDPAGELDALTSPTLDKHLDYELRDPHHRQLILNVGHLSFCGVAGLTSLLRARALAHDQHTGLHLVSGALVERLLHLTDLHDRFVTYLDLTTALTAASSAVRAGACLPQPPTPASSRPDRVQMSVS